MSAHAGTSERRWVATLRTGTEGGSSPREPTVSGGDGRLVGHDARQEHPEVAADADSMAAARMLRTEAWLAHV